MRFDPLRTVHRESGHLRSGHTRRMARIWGHSKRLHRTSLCAVLVSIYRTVVLHELWSRQPPRSSLNLPRREVAELALTIGGSKCSRAEHMQVDACRYKILVCSSEGSATAFPPLCCSHMWHHCLFDCLTAYLQQEACWAFGVAFAVKYPSYQVFSETLQAFVGDWRYYSCDALPLLYQEWKN